MFHLVLWDPVASHLRAIRRAWRDHVQMKHFCSELERLQSLGDYLIEDIGLDPQEVREWLESLGRSPDPRQKA
jgi:uncharacterized protein YjiS (DUF1127 family)